MNKDWSNVLGSILRLVVGVGGLVALVLILDMLPPMKDPNLPSWIRPTLNVILMTSLILVIFWFGVRMKADLALLLPHFPDAGSMVLALSVLIAVSVGYFAYRGVANWLYPRNLSWLYPVIFLLLSLGALGVLAVLAFNNIDKLTQLLLGQPRTQMPPPPMEQRPVQPTATMSQTPAGSVSAEKPSQPPPAQNRCPICGTVTNPGDVFCGSCGTRLKST
jgi:hypothetical protein